MGKQRYTRSDQKCGDEYQYDELAGVKECATAKTCDFKAPVRKQCDDCDRIEAYAQFNMRKQIQESGILPGSESNTQKYCTENDATD